MCTSIVNHPRATRTCRSCAITSDHDIPGIGAARIAGAGIGYIREPWRHVRGAAGVPAMTASATEQFRAAIHAAGLTPPDEIEADGKLRRFPSNGKRSDAAGWYLLHGDGIPAGSFGDWRTGFSQTWRADIGRTLTPAEEAAHRARVEAMRREREAEEAKRRKDAATTAAAIWEAAASAPEDHPYLVRKGIKAHGLKVADGRLVVPMRAGGELHSLQYIGPEGVKRFLPGGRVTGCYFSIGSMQGAATLCIAEGFATGASILKRPAGPWPWHSTPATFYP